MSRSTKFLLGLLALLTCLSLQFWLVPFGIHVDLAFSALIAFAFIFEIIELIPLILVGVFLINWQPELSLDIIVFAIIPVFVYFMQKAIHADRWIGGMVAIVTSLLLLYLVIAPTMIIGSFASFFLDIIICLATNQIILWGMEERR